MGKIFVISKNPVSTIESALGLNPIIIKNPKQYPDRILRPLRNTKDSFVSCERQKEANAFIKMRNGIGKLMPHFSRKNKV